ncbi:signal transduction histidine kinase [Bradyrhizobium sp. S3.12.5]|uniref:histidine kinase dimerization/phospho-acceptor domain-containing protein n=1 Tax=Bradyrhizobium sp. S3.12.5 TaxID=3156386 RepID=UPI0033952438
MRKTEASRMPYSDVIRMEGRPIPPVMDGDDAGSQFSDFESVLLAIAGHDLRQPLQAIQSVHDLLGSGERTEAELRVLSYGQTAINGLRDQLDQLLDALRPRTTSSES